MQVERGPAGADHSGGTTGDARDWDGATYDRVADPMTRWGANVLERLRLRGDERVLDAGCGSGRVTEQLLERLPRGTVVALDASPSMLAEAARRLERFGNRVTLVCADLGQPLPVEGMVDAVLSTATLHWVADHDALFRNLVAVLRPAGQFVAQWGGAGNIQSVLDALRAAGETWPGPWNFAPPEATRRRLEAAGFEVEQIWLHDEPTPLGPGAPLETYLETVILGAHLERLPDAARKPYVRVVAQHLPTPVLDYVRLNVVARRAG